MVSTMTIATIRRCRLGPPPEGFTDSAVPTSCLSHRGQGASNTAGLKSDSRLHSGQCMYRNWDGWAADVGFRGNVRQALTTITTRPVVRTARKVRGIGLLPVNG